ncbi:HIT family protein [Catenuloplanes sp. NPDC051500]|uniref:HIT family protein n=1 Tax=Catenuloplanes sp. NPDC051500 TaxID=3363959 RepID=UPI00378A0541
MADCVFCAIVAGTTPAFVVTDTPAGVAFLDTRPVFKGHVLVVPRAHVPTLTDLDLDAVGPFFTLVRRLAAAVETGLGAGGTFVAMNNRVSQSVPHLHAHVVPRTKGDGLRGFFWPRTRYSSDDEARTFTSQITNALEGTDMS